ncbi:MAG: ribonuclease HII, partial [Xanthomonadaceae bacterium]|nr:ribonuclease HII [Xanthomonadaceae bacterium]
MTGYVAGVDEAGRGPLAGPVAVAAVILDPVRPIEGLADSKQLSARRREALYALIVERAIAHAVVCVEAVEIDRVNILNATLAGMTRALEALSRVPSLALIDGNRLPKSLPCPARAIVGG